MGPLAARVVARYLAADGVLAEPGTTYVYQVDSNNEVLYPGETVLVRVGEKLVRGEVVLGNKSVRTEGGAQLPSLAVKAEDGNIYDATSSSVMKLRQTIPTKRTVEANIPEVVREVRMEPHEYLVCPHCKQDIHEKALFHDGANYFHSASTCRGKPVKMPPPKPETIAWLKQLGLEK